MLQSSEVVITGLGVVSPIGVGKDAFWNSLMQGRSGVGPLSFAANTNLPVKFGAEIRNFDPKQFVKPRKSLKVMCREIQTGYSAAIMALEDAGLQTGSVEPDRFGIVLGSEMFYCELEELADAYRKCIVDGELQRELWGVSIMSHLYPLWMLKYLPNMVACHLAISQDARGPNNTITLDEVSCLLAFIEAVAVIERGAADVMITGGSGTRTNLTHMLYRGDKDCSHRHDDPQRAARPFDARRDGGVIGEGAGAIILERRQHAEARGARILARVLGYGRGFEATPDYQPGPGDGVRHSIREALARSGLRAQDIGHVNAHGASTVKHDRMEAQAIHDCLGDTPVTALKSYFGSLGAGSGAVETVGSVLAVGAGLVPATLNYENPDPECPVNVIHGRPLQTDKNVAIALNQSTTGQAAAVIIAGP
ncbi:MAG: beta-ketoacyl-[acyl-carrier-protein] synthase family protein [Planctomycetota bacterium]|nr:beta-ketoacyl-[acyl-carrier-protein] synthase family protein [Planctomycetota bacterium]